MEKVHIVTDSASHIPEALRRELEIHVVHLPYVWEQETYLDEIDMGPREFYARLRQSETLPTTSGPTPGSFRSKFEELIGEGGPILLIHVGSEFSSTSQTARIAREMLPTAKIQLVDSHSNALGLGFQVIAVARAAREGLGFDRLVELAHGARDSTGVVFSVEDLDYLQLGGRINFGQRLLASVLSLVPVMEIRQGPIEIIGRARSSKMVMTKLVDSVEARVHGRRPIRIGVQHADREQKAFQLRRMVEESIEPDELILEELTPILGVHTGPGALGLAYSAGL